MKCKKTLKMHLGELNLILVRYLYTENGPALVPGPGLLNMMVDHNPVRTRMSVTSVNDDILQ
mgnify:CR=1 FL=1